MMFSPSSSVNVVLLHDDKSDAPIQDLINYPVFGVRIKSQEMSDLNFCYEKVSLWNDKSKIFFLAGCISKIEAVLTFHHHEHLFFSKTIDLVLSLQTVGVSKKKKVQFTKELPCYC